LRSISCLFVQFFWTIARRRRNLVPDAGRGGRAAGLLPAEHHADADVLNGIAAIGGTDEFLLTGKLWPVLFRVRFVPA
jgi:glutamine cyclotransferase